MTAEACGDEADSPFRTLVLYDGVCGLCNRLVAFLLRHDRRDEFCFAPLQSGPARNLLRRHCLDPDDLDTVVVIADYRRPHERALTRSQAALWATVQLGGVWRLFSIIQIAPLFLRELAYRFIARRRYRLFGRYDQCLLPKPAERRKFLTSAI